MRRAGYFFSVALVILPLGADEILDQKAGVRKVAGGCKFTEGPAVSPGGELFFSDIENNRIMKVAGSGKVQEFRRPSGRANGIVFDSRGRLVMCQGGGPGGGRRVARLEKDGRETVLAETYGGKKFIAPNDLCIDGLGRIFFTDPYYGPPAVKSQPSSGVYLIRAGGKVQLLLKDLLKYVMKDESRHVAFGVLSLKGYYDDMSASELVDREDFVIYASELMRNRLVGTDIARAMGWDEKAVTEHTLNSETGRAFRGMLFMRVVPNLKKLGVLTPRVRKAFTELEIIQFEDVDTDALDRQMDFL